MGPNDTAVAERIAAGLDTPLDQAQIHKASKALLKHLNESKHSNDSSAKTKNLLETDKDSIEEPIWLITTTKKHIVPQKRLKPTKILLPHPILTSPTLSICLITPDPQRIFKDAIAHPSFPTDLSRRITRIIDIKKLAKKYHSFESKRQLLATHDLFLADDRIITYLPKLLGKTFYTSTTKRPIPICLQPSKTKPPNPKNSALPSTKPPKKNPEPRSLLPAPQLAHAINQTLQSTTLNLTPTTTTAVRIGLASLSPEALSANITAVTSAIVDRFVKGQWGGVRSVHIKGPESVALPVWLAERLWSADGDGEGEGGGMVLEEGEAERMMVQGKGEEGRKRKVEDAGLGDEVKRRREKLKVQKRG